MTKCDEEFEKWRSQEDWSQDYGNAQFYRAERAWDAAWKSGYKARQSEIIHLLNQLLMQQGKLHEPE